MADPTAIDAILDKLARDVESSIHAFYRGDVRQHTQRVKTDTFVREAKQALLSLGSAPEAGSTPTGSPSAGSTPLNSEEVAAAMRCVMGWHPMGLPNAASAQS